MLPRLSRRSDRHVAICVFVFWVVCATSSLAGTAWTFVDVTAAAGLYHDHGYPLGPATDSDRIAAGVAAGDVNGDGWPDVYLVRGSIGPNLLLLNRKDGTFVDAGVAVIGTAPERGAGGLIADLDGDGWLDVLVGSIKDSSALTNPALFRNTGGGQFVNATPSALTVDPRGIYSMSLGDLDRDGDLDLACAHWTSSPPNGLSVWRNDGGFNLVHNSFSAGVLNSGCAGFAPNFTDIDDDGWLDLLVACDFGTSVVYTSDGDGTLTQQNLPVLTDENGMGAAIGDYDGDGLLDWFVSSIWEADMVGNGWGITGNRLYKNLGGGAFADVTEAAGVREGYWGWGSCFADFNNDGWLDLFHVNGFSAENSTDFYSDPSRMFVSQGDGTFVEDSTGLGLDDTDQGRGVVCFDYDRDGDVDILIANNSDHARLYRNDGGNAQHFLSLELAGDPPNTQGIGARVALTVAGVTQIREFRAGSNFESSNPAVEHFGLGAATTIDELRVDWPSGPATVLNGVAADQFLTVTQSAAPPPTVPATVGAGSQGMLVGKLNPTGSNLSLSLDVSTCSPTDHRIVYGFGAQLPSAPGGAFQVAGAVCDVGNGATIAWNGTPDPASDPQKLLWWIVVADDGGITEGSWGTDGDGLERYGPGLRGTSGRCSAMRKDLTRSCGR